MFLDADGNKLMKHTGPRTVAGFRESLETIAEFQELTKKAADGDEKAATELFIRQLKLGWFSLDEAREHFGKLKKVSSKQKKAIEIAIAELEVQTLTKEAGDKLAERVKAGARFHAMYKDKMVPEEWSTQYSFWLLMADYAEDARDKKLFKKIVGEFEDAMPSSTSSRKALKSLESRLKNFPK